MPNMGYDQESGALLFTPTADELEQLKSLKKVAKLEAKIQQLEELINTLLSKQGNDK